MIHLGKDRDGNDSIKTFFVTVTLDIEKACYKGRTAAPC